MTNHVPAHPTAEPTAPQTTHARTAPQELESRLQHALWSFSSPYWNGYVDFRELGHYWTHWGFGTWRLVDAHRIHMRNSYDLFYFDVRFDPTLTRLQVTASNHPTRPVGRALFNYGTASLITPLGTSAGTRVSVVDVQDAQPPRRAIETGAPAALPPWRPQR